MRKILDRRKSEELIALQCEQCGHHELALEAELRACPICGWPMTEIPEYEDEEEERR
ncbi:MAG: hypothetical protein HY314_10645 [Acidobacteria bacterium]|nr:hypothetical protein [Acidobacteriota bacterium]